MAISQPTYPISTSNLVSHVGAYTDQMLNSRILTLTTPALGISAAYVTDTYEALPGWLYDQSVTASVPVDQSATLSIETSTDGTTWSTAATSGAGTGTRTAAAGVDIFWRVRLLNGATAQGAQTITVVVDLGMPV